MRQCEPTSQQRASKRERFSPAAVCRRLRGLRRVVGARFLQFLPGVLCVFVCVCVCVCSGFGSLRIAVGPFYKRPPARPPEGGGESRGFAYLKKTAERTKRSGRTTPRRSCKAQQERDMRVMDRQTTQPMRSTSSGPSRFRVCISGLVVRHMTFVLCRVPQRRPSPRRSTVAAHPRPVIAQQR